VDRWRKQVNKETFNSKEKVGNY